MSVPLRGIGPGRQPGDRIELPQELADHAVRVVFGAQLLELREHARERPVCFADRLLGEVFPLGRETLAVTNELLAIKVCDEGDGGSRTPFGLTNRAVRLLA